MSDSRLPDPLRAARCARPEHPAICCGGESLNYHALDERVEQRAAALAAAGVRAGEIVALRGPANLDFAVDFHALARLRAVSAPFSFRAGDEEIADLLQRCGARHRLGDLPDALEVPSPNSPAKIGKAADLDDVRLLMHTSGTTGIPRKVSITVRQMLFSAMSSALRLGHLPSDRWVACLPLHHVGGLSILYRCALYATTVDLHERFDPQAVDASIEAGASHVSLVPVMLRRLLDERGDRPFPSTLRAILLGGARTPRELVERCRAIDAPVALTWGMTETASQVATREPGDFTSGAPPLPFADISADEAGALWIRGPHAPGGEFQTSDLGYVENGRVHVTGRRDDVLISGGENIDPREIEQVLAEHEAVGDVAVVGVPDEEWGERPIAFVETTRGASEEELIEHCRARLTGFKVPARVFVLEELPRNELGKVRRGELRSYKMKSERTTQP